MKQIEIRIHANLFCETLTRTAIRQGLQLFFRELLNYLVIYTQGDSLF